MPLFGRKSRPVGPPSHDLPSGEEVERAVRAELLHGKSVISGSLFLTNRRMLFEAEKGDARWLSVPFGEVKSAGLYRWPRATMGNPASGHLCLAVETTKGEQVWWNFGDRDEQEWLPLVQQRAEAARAATDSAAE
jgi:hypothetical protein